MMLSNKAILFILLLPLSLERCTSELEEQKEAEKVKVESIKGNIGAIQKIISDSLYPNNIVYTGNRLMINLNTALPEMYYENKMGVIRERAIFLIRDKIKQVDTLWINFDIKELKKEPLIAYYDRPGIDKVIQLESNDKMQYDFKSYIVKHLDGEKLFRFSTYLTAVKTANPEFEVSDDYIQMLFLLIDESRGKLKNRYIRQILITLRNLIILDNKEWKDFNQEDVDYFLNYKGKPVKDSSCITCKGH